MPENNHEEEALKAPPRLISALKRVSKAPSFIPRSVDEAVLHAAQRHLARQQKREVGWAVLLRWAFAAAALVLLLAIIPQVLRKGGFTQSARLAGHELNQGHPVDILDAFALARELKTGAHPSGQWDVNRDGVVDERDVAALAARAVSLGKSGS